jgi:hypothetical protein
MEKEFEALDRLYKCNDDDYTLGYRQHDYKLLQQALTTKSKKEQAFDIIVKKSVDINWFTTFKGTEFYTYERYVSSHKMTKLTKEEFDLLKGILKNE